MFLSAISFLEKDIFVLLLIAKAQLSFKFIALYRNTRESINVGFTANQFTLGQSRRNAIYVNVH
jgi:hypothetical protein